MDLIKGVYDIAPEEIEQVTEETFEEFLDKHDIYWGEIIEIIVAIFGNRHIGYADGCEADTGIYILFFSKLSLGLYW